MKALTDTSGTHITSDGFIPLSKPEISGNEWRYVKDCLDSGWVSSAGEYVDRFEKKLAAYHGRRFGVATVNGTSALHLALVSCGVAPGDEVLVPAMTFVATANAVVYAGAKPVFMDCDGDTLCMDAEKVRGFLSNECSTGAEGMPVNRRSKRRVGAILPVHVLGHPAQMHELCAIAREYNVPVIEDSAQALGSEYSGGKAGSFGLASCLSFNGNKIITCGGGGMLLTDDSDVARRARHLSTQAKEPHPYEFAHTEIGFNYRFSALQAAMGLAQAERLDEFVSAKRAHAAAYRELLSGIEGLEVVWERPWVRSNFWLCTIKVPARERDGLIERLISERIQVRPLWTPLHTLSIYENCQAYAVEKAAEAHRRCVSLPSSAGLTGGETERVCSVIKGHFERRWEKTDS